VFCELIAPDRVRVTAPHLPEGASVSLDDRGYRIWPYELLVPLGPLSLLVEIRDQARVEPDGEFVDDLEIRLLGVTFAKAELRVRPEQEREPQGPGASSPARAGVGS
jgi:hypothetical protein